jgi:hypothetical protein
MVRPYDLKGKVLVYRVVDLARGGLSDDPDTTQLVGIEYLDVEAALDKGARFWIVADDELNAVRYLTENTFAYLGPATLKRQRPGPGGSTQVPLSPADLKSFTKLYKGACELQQSRG